MYPVLRFAIEMAITAQAGPLPLDGTHVSRHTCMPWDIDPFLELNNGRMLTLADLGRIPLVVRTGLFSTLRRNGWGLALAGVSVRYRRRVRMFHRFELRSRCIGRDERFIYIHQVLWRRGEALASLLYRGAVTGPGGIVATDRVADALGQPDWRPEMPGWVGAWIAAEGQRAWPPER